MKELGSIKDMQKIEHLPIDVQTVIKEALEILDESYGVERDINTTGGLVIVIEKDSDFPKLMKYGLDFEYPVIGEYQDEIGNYISILILQGDDYSILLVMPSKLRPKSIII